MRHEHGATVLKAREYVGTIVLPRHVLVLRPKIEKLNFFHMLASAYDLVDLGTENLQYLRDHDILEIIVHAFLEKVERLAKSGLSKDYFTQEDNLPYLRGRWFIEQDIRKNPILRDRIFCRFSEFSADTCENRILKFALFRLAQIPFSEEGIQREAQRLFRYFESVFLITTEAQIPPVTYTRLNEHYKPIVNLATLIIKKSTVNLEKAGEVWFYSFLVDMNVLFERFLRGYLKQNLPSYRVVGSPRGEALYTLFESGKFGQKPDIIIMKNTAPILVVDAKYKKIVSYEDIAEADIGEMMGYSHALGIKLAVLAYPQQEDFMLDGKPERVRHSEIEIAYRTVRLSRHDRNEFLTDVAEFAKYLTKLIQSKGLS